MCEYVVQIADGSEGWGVGSEVVNVGAKAEQRKMGKDHKEILKQCREGWKGVY